MKADKNVTYTSTLPNTVMEEVVEYAKTMRLSKNKVIESAILYFLEEEKRKKYVSGFKRVGGDSEMKKIAEEGMKDYSNQLKKF